MMLGTLIAFTALTVEARPVVIEEAANFTAPDAALYPDFGYEVATNGQYALTSGFRSEPNGEVWHYSALLYRRVNGQWVFERELAHNQHYYDSYSYPVEFAMKGNLAAVEIADGVRGYQLDAAGWVPSGLLGGHSEDIETDGVRFVHSSGGWDATASERNATGGWTLTPLQGQPRGNDDEFWGGPIDFSGNFAILGTPYTYDLEPQEIPIYQRLGASNWQLYGKIQVPEGDWRLGAQVALRGNDAIVEGSGGAYVWRLNDLTTPVDRLRALDQFTLGRGEAQFEHDGSYVFVLERSYDRGVNVINVYRTGANGRYEHAATLVAKNGATLTGSFDVAGNVVMASGADRVHVFELPANLATPPASLQENFESGNGAHWSPSAGAQFTVAQQGTNRVYRQASLAGDAQAVLSDSHFTDQAIEADIRPTAFEGNDRWVGLATRRADAQNYYYVTLRSSGSVQLRRLRNGVVTTLANTPLTVTANRTYRVRLESIGSAHRVYVDGQLMGVAFDAGTPLAGSAAIVMYKARADYDNVVVSASPRTTMFANNFDGTSIGVWDYDAGEWNLARSAFAQTSIAGDARVTIGTPTDDQSVALRVRPVAYALPSGTQERWVGVMARYTDERNYYYLSLRSGNTLSLRKVVNGAITTLAVVPATVNVGTWYSLKLEAVGSSLRGYLNGALVLQATDSAHPSGTTGPVTFKAAADFDDYVAYQP